MQPSDIPMGLRRNSQPLVILRQRCPLCGEDYVTHACPSTQVASQPRVVYRYKPRIDYIIIVTLVLLSSMLTVLSVIAAR